MITGAQRGIGYATAERLFSEGANVVLVDIDALPIRGAAQKLGGETNRALGIAADISKKSDVDEVVSRTLECFGSVDILVNNAGISPKHDGKSAPIAKVSLGEWQRVLDVNLTGTFMLTQACLSTMKNAGWGRIINMSSQAARTASKVAGAHYAASKAGIIAFSRILANEVAANGITVNCIAPGRIVTPMAEEAGDEVNQAYLRHIPVGRLGTSQDIAGAISFLVSDDAEFITGTTLDVNGGVFMS